MRIQRTVHSIRRSGVAILPALGLLFLVALSAPLSIASVDAQALEPAGLERLTQAIQRQKQQHQELRRQLDRLERAAADLKSDDDETRSAARQRLKLAISGSGDPMIKPAPVGRQEDRKPAIEP